MRFTLLSLLLLFFSTLLPAQKSTDITDGPYVFVERDSLRLWWVQNGEKHDSTVSRTNPGIFRKDSLPVVDLSRIKQLPTPETDYRNVKKIVALSDVHGQYAILRQLLTAQGITDKNGKWTYGDGHLVVVGDNMDRGDKVTEILWYLFFLQKEAVAAGGRLHVLLGNHEMMVLRGDLRYLNRKYVIASAFFTTPYQDFFRTGSVLGDWLRRQNVVLRLNDQLFVHGGISPKLQELGFSPEQVNKQFRNKVLPAEKDDIFKNDRLYTLYADDGPLWYRGYFGKDAISDTIFQEILDRWKIERMIVGHTSQPMIESRYGGKLFVVDCSIKLGQSGQLLIIRPEGVFVGRLDGTQRAVDDARGSVTPRESLFDHLFRADERPEIRIVTNTRRLVKKSSKEEYQPATYTFDLKNGAEIFTLEGKIRARGNMRKQVCFFPPLKLDFNKGDLDSLGYLKLDKLKLVIPCRTGVRSQQLLYKEFFAYQLYEPIDTNHLRTRLVDLVMNNGTEDRYRFVALMIEDEESYKIRKNVDIVERGNVNAHILERTSWIKMRFFEYLIANTDWSIYNRHNVELVRLPDRRVVAVPYDFDYSGMVGQGYASPHPSLPIKDVQERYFKQSRITEAEFDATLSYYQNIKEDLYAVVNRADYFDERASKEVRRYVDEFYKILDKPGRMKKQAMNYGQ